MTDGVLGGIGLTVFALMVVAVALLFRRRPTEAVVTMGRVRGQPGLTVHPWRGHWFTAAVAWLLLALLVVWGLALIGSNNYAAGALLLCALWSGYLGWCRVTGRAGDGSITLTPGGIHQLYAGSEVFIDWDDVRGLVTTPTDFIVETTRPVVPTPRMVPLLGGRRSVVTDGAIALPRRGLPPLPFQDMIHLYSTVPSARDELGTEDVVQRARSLLAAVP